MSDTWPVRPLGELCEIELGRTPSRAKLSYWDEKKRTNNVWLSIADLLDAKGDVVTDSAEYVSDEGAKLCKLVRKGTLLVSFKLTLGRLAYAGRDLFTNEAIAALTLKDQSLSKEYLFWYLQHFDWDKAAEGDEKVKGKTLNKAKLQVLPVIVPPLPEQRRIVAFLDEAFAAIATAKANTEQNLANARAVFESHANGLWRTEHAGWARTELGKVADRVTVGHVGITSPYYRDSGVIFLRTQNVTARGIDLSDVKYITQEFHDSLKKSQVRAGDVLLSRVISREVNCAKIPEDLGPANCANVVAVRPGDKLVPEFLVYYIRSTDAQAYLLSRKVGSAQLVVNTTVVKKWPIVVPPIAVQRELVAALNQLREETQRLESLAQRKLSALDALKASLLHHAFTGQLTGRPAPSRQEHANA